jgi:hypothetical protein
MMPETLDDLDQMLTPTLGMVKEAAEEHGIDLSEQVQKEKEKVEAAVQSTEPRSMAGRGALTGSAWWPTARQGSPSCSVQYRLSM